MKNKTILVTGSAGFIGFHLCRKLILEEYNVIGIDSLSPYYDPQLKKDRLLYLESMKEAVNFNFFHIDLCNKKEVVSFFSKHNIDTVCHLAAQAGVRYSFDFPQSYIDNNITATLNLLEECKNHEIKDFIFASTSSVYGLNKDLPFNTDTNIDSPISIYSTSKRACELLCFNYHHIYKIRFRILRFFTVYGPWGRPDMALFKFTKSIIEGREIEIYNNGQMSRDFTYVDDIVNGFISSIVNKFEFEIFNLGRGKPVNLLSFIEILEKNLGIISKKKHLPMQKGDVSATWADVSKSKEMLKFEPKINVEEGIKNFTDWYKQYYNIK